VTYLVMISRRALKSLDGLERQDQQRIRAVIELLAENPRPPSCIPLAGERGVYRVRVGDYRVLYEVHDGRLIVQVIAVGHRREVYR
jgi:mRNA interferase RelE/StbE